MDTTTFERWTTDELLEATTFEQAEYSEKALGAMEQELARRDVSDAERARFEERRWRAWKQWRADQTGIRGSLSRFLVWIGLYSVFLLLAGWDRLSTETIESVAVGVLCLVVACFGFVVLGLLTNPQARQSSAGRRVVRVDPDPFLRYRDSGTLDRRGFRSHRRERGCVQRRLVERLEHLARVVISDPLHLR